MSMPSDSSGSITADSVVCARPAVVTSVVVIGDGTNAASVILYDNASAASGKKLVTVSVDAGLVYEQFHADGGVLAANGIYADVTGTGCEAIVHFRLL